MSIERTKNGSWRVRWREGKRNRAHFTGPKHKDAEIYEQEIKRAKRMGTLAHMEMGTDTFEAFARIWWERHASRKAHKTQVLYAYLLDKHIAPYFGQTPLALISVAEIEGWLANLEKQGTGRVAQHKALSLLSGILGKAVRWQKLATNPAAYAERPKVIKKPVKPPTPLEVEHVREALGNQGRMGDAVLVSVLAYAGLRPQEALALRWADIGERAVVVHAPKTNANRSVPLLAPLRKDLAEWKLLMENRHELVFPNRRGEQWSESGWSNWRRRVWHELADFPPKDLRHTFCSLLIRDDALPLLEQAQVAGHTLQVHLDVYSHIFADLKGKGSAEVAIRRARAAVLEERETA